MRHFVFYGFILSVFILGCNGNERSLFKSVPASESGIEFVNRLTEKPGLNILYYLYYYNGAGVAAGDINNDGLTDLYFSSNTKGANKLYLNKGNLTFEDITEKAGVGGIADWCTGVTMADVNGDELTDIYVVSVSGDFGLTGRNALYINQGDLTFKEQALEAGLGFSALGTQAAFFDYDHDGDLDCYLLNHSKRPHANLVPAGNRMKPDTLKGDKLLRNELAETGRLTFKDVSADAGIYSSSLGYGLGISVADFNNDGWEDLYIGNDFHENDYLYLNNGNGTFSESGLDYFGHFSRFSMGNDAADIDNDGNIDLVTVDMLPPDEKTLKTYGSDENLNSYLSKIVANGYRHQVSRNCIQRNLGETGFSDVALMGDAFATDWSWCPIFADFDNDGSADLFISSGIVKRPVDLDYVMYVSALSQQKGMDMTDAYDAEAIDKMPDGATHPFFFKGNGNFGFQDVSEDWGTGEMKGYFNGAAYADLDNDGDLDVIMNVLEGKSVLLKNNSMSSSWMKIKLKGDSLNTHGIGTRVVAFAGDKVYHRQLQTSRGFMSCSESILHIGLGNATKIDSIWVIWPDQKVERLTGVGVNATLEVQYANAQAKSSFPFQQLFRAGFIAEPLPVPGMTWKHEENPYLDFNRQYLVPHMQSIRGPALAVADVNGDGLDDFFAGGAAGQPGVLMLQTADGVFRQARVEAFERNAACEEVDALFFDANHDNYWDLYVVSGGAQWDDGDERLSDHLYLGDGKGNFTEVANSLPGVHTNKSCVASLDADKDGDIDLLVAGHVNAGVYGPPQDSYLLLNDGKGNFSTAPTEMVHLSKVGMVTSIAIGDLNSDGFSDFVLCGEWMPLKIFYNKGGKVFEPFEIPGSSGLWQNIRIDDVDGDGKMDIMGGNWGLNSKRASGKEGPLKLYIKDFDKNGRVEQIMTYHQKGKEYPFYAKDELERAIPELKKYYLTYSEVAGQTVQYMLYNLFEGYQELKAEILASGVFTQDSERSFRFQAFPFDLQLAPVSDFSRSGQRGWIAAGNFTGVLPYEGRYDAMPLTFFEYNPSAGMVSARPFANTRNRDVRKIHSIGLKGKKYFLIGVNNEGITLVPER